MQPNQITDAAEDINFDSEIIKWMKWCISERAIN